MNIKLWLLIIAFTLPTCTGTHGPIKFQESNVITKDVHAQSSKTNGIVLLDINWGRWWGCGKKENAQLISLAFDRLPPLSLENEAEPSLAIRSPGLLMVKPEFLNYAFTLEPGEYAISALSIKVAESMTNNIYRRERDKLYYLAWQRSELYKEGKPIGGSFIVKPGENVFIGNFYLDCTYGPTLWRYYSENRADFNKQLKEYKKSFPFLDLSDVKYRLFKTSKFGHDHELAP